MFAGATLDDFSGVLPNGTGVPLNAQREYDIIQHWLMIVQEKSYRCTIKRMHSIFVETWLKQTPPTQCQLEAQETTGLFADDHLWFLSQFVV